MPSKRKCENSPRKQAKRGRIESKREGGGEDEEGGEEVVLVRWAPRGLTILSKAKSLA